MAAPGTTNRATRSREWSDPDEAELPARMDVDKKDVPDKEGGVLPEETVEGEVRRLGNKTEE